MTNSTALLELLVILGTAAVVALGFAWLRLPAVLGYVAAGLIIGPHVPVPLVADPHLVHVLAELGVIFLMYTIGLELRLSTLAKVGVGAGLTAVFEVGLVIAGAVLVARLLGFGTVEAVFIGASLGISSTMVVAKTFEQLRWKGPITEAVFAILVFEDLLAIVLLTVLTGLAEGAGLAPLQVLVTVGKLLGFVAAAMLVGLLIVPRLLRRLWRQELTEVVLLVSLAVCFGGAVASHSLGFSVALGAFVAGVVVAESGLGHGIGDLMRPLRDVFAVVFFVSIGMMVDPRELAQAWPSIVALTALVLVAKPVGVALGAFATGRGFETAVRAGITMAQTGEFGFVIAGIGVSAGVAGPQVLAIAVGVTCLTTVSSGLLIPRSAGLAQSLRARLPERLATFTSFYEGWLARLRQRERTAWARVRRPVVVLAVDMAGVIIVAIGGAVAGPRVARALGFVPSTWPVRLALIGAVVLVALPLAIGVVRRIVSIAKTLGTLIIPITDAVDRGRAPRRALELTFEVALAAVCVVALIAATQPFVGGAVGAIGVIVLVLVGLTLRAITDFRLHVRAGSELLLELLHNPVPTDRALDEVEQALPGFGETTPVRLAPGAPAIGQSLAQLDLRARTGATVLAIARGAGGHATPSPIEPLMEGDILALTGSAEAVALAKLELQGAPTAAPAP